MMKERQTGGKILKSAIAVLMAVAVAVLTLPGFKMDVRAYVDQEPYQYNFIWGENYQENAPDFDLFSDPNGGSQGTSGTIASGQVIWVPDDVTVAGLSNLASRVEFEYGGFLYTLTSNVNFEKTGNTEFTFTQGTASNDTTSTEETVNPPASVDDATTDDTAVADDAAKSDDTAVADDTAKSDDTVRTDDTAKSDDTAKTDDTVKTDDTAKGMDPKVAQKLWAQFIAESNAEKEKLTQQRQADKIYKDKLLQAQIDNQYYRNLNEAKALGKNMIVLPETHAVIPSTVKGTYLATYKNGFAAVALDSKANPDLYIDTWDITDQKAPDAMRSINDEVTRLGGTLVGALQINIGVKNGKGETVYDGDGTPVANVKFGIPNDGGKYAIVQVQALSDGPSIKTFDNLAIENGVATLSLPIGQAAYGIVRLPD